MKINNIERIIIDNWFLSNKVTAELTDLSTKQVSLYRSKLRKRFKPEQRNYLT